MSGIVLVVDGVGPEPAAVERVLQALAHRGPDGSDEVLLPWATLGHRRFRTTPEEVGERQPLRSGVLHLALDGRIDNRADIAAALEVDPGEGRSLTDAGLLLKAWERWGADALPRIVGSYALAVVDAATGRVTLARDPLGDRSLFYWSDGRRFVAASEPAAVLAYPGVPRQLDEARLARLFALAEPARGSTFFAAVREVPPAHTVTFEKGRVALSRYWEPGTTYQTRPLRDDEWCDAFVEALERAVTCRLRAVGRPAVLLSGGLDSGPVAALAARNLVAERLLSVSWVFDELGSCDERRFSDEIARMWGLETVHVPCDDAWPLADLAKWPFDPNGPQQNVYRGCVERGYRAAHAKGARVMLSGYCGDDLYVDSGDWMIDLIREGRVRETWSELRRESRTLGMPTAVRRWVLAPLVPAPIWRHRRERFRARSTPWLTPYARSLLGPDPWAEGYWSRSCRKRPGQRRAIFGDWFATGVAAEDRYASQAGVEVRYPFRDRRLVELALAMPSHLLHRGQITRPVVRQAFRNLLPTSVLARDDKASFRPLLDRAMFGTKPGAFRTILCRRGGLASRFVDDAWVDSALSTLRPGSPRAFDLVLWLRVFVDLWSERAVE